MKLLLDTHAVIWAHDGSGRLGVRGIAAIEAAETVYVSAASAWEASIKAALGKLTMPWTFERLVEEARFTPLPITLRHADAVRALPLHHSDPFDRMLIAQTLVEGLVLMTHDAAIHRYSVPTFII